MAYLKKTSLFKRILFSRTTALVIVLVIIFMGYGLFSLAGKSIEAAKARKIAENQAAALVAKQDSLTSKLAILNTPDGKESALREQFPVVKPGEHMVVITDDTKNTPVQTASDEPSKSGGGFWNFLKNLFR
jgi:cell division protein FtsB